MRLLETLGWIALAVMFAFGVWLCATEPTYHEDTSLPIEAYQPEPMPNAKTQAVLIQTDNAMKYLMNRRDTDE